MTGLIRRYYGAFKEEILAVPARTVALVFLIALWFVPVVTRDPYILLTLAYMNIFVIYAASWDFLGGVTGQFCMGHGALFGVAAYVAGLLCARGGLPIWATVPLGAGAAIVTGLLIGIPALRLRGVYFSLVSMVFPLILTGIVAAFPDITGGEMGVSGIAAISTNRTVLYYTTLPIMIVSVAIMWKLTDTRSKLVRLGIILRAIREDEISARCSGINTVRYKLIAFVVSGFFAGLAGGLYVHVIRIAGPSTLELLWSFNPIVWTVLGGMGIISGSVTGVFVLYPLMEFVKVIPEWRMLIYAGIIIAVLLLMPEGLVVWFRDKVEKECPRCKLVNAATRKHCRACSALLRPVDGVSWSVESSDEGAAMRPTSAETVHREGGGVQ